MRITPLAPGLPYIDLFAASFSTLIPAMSYGLMPASAPPGPGVMATPSMMYSGWLSGFQLAEPRMRTVRLPSDACPIVTPGRLLGRIFSMGMSPELVMADDETVLSAGCGAGAVSGGFPPPHAEMNAAPRIRDFVRSGNIKANSSRLEGRSGIMSDGAA